MASFSIKAVIGATTSPFKRAVGGLKGFVKRTFSGLGGILAGVFSVGLVKGLFSEFDRLAKLAKQLRLPAATVQKFSVAAELGGTNVEALSKAMLQSERNAIKAEQGLVTYQRAFSDLGIDTKEFLKLGIEDKLVRIADAYEKSGDKGKAIAALQETLGRSGRELVPILEEGAQGVRELLDSIDTLEEADFEAIQNANDALTSLSNNIKVTLIPYIIELVQFLGFLAIKFGQGVVIIKEFGKELFKLSTYTGLFSDDPLKNFREAAVRTGDAIEESEKALLKFIERTEKASAKQQKPLIDAAGYVEKARALQDLTDIQAKYDDDLERSAAAEKGIHEETLFMLKKRADIRREIQALGEVSEDPEANKEILRLKKEELAATKEIDALIVKSTDQTNKKKEAIERLKTEQKIAELRAGGNEKAAAALERQTELLKEARSFLESIGEEATGANLEAVFEQLEKTRALQESVQQTTTEAREAVSANFRNIGGNDPIGVALSGPFDKQVEAQKETTREVKRQTETLTEGLQEVVDAVGAGGTVNFATLS